MTGSVGSLAAYLSVRGAAQARRDILSVQESLSATGAAATEAGAALTRSETALIGAGAASVRASSGANRLRAAQLGVVSATERYNAVLVDENATVARLATAEAGLIRANERVASTTRVNAAAQAKAAEAARLNATATTEASVASSRWSQATGGTVKQLGLMVGGFALLKSAIDIGKETSAFQKQMLLVQTQTGQTAGDVKFLSDGLLGMAASLATSPQELAKSVYHFASIGETGKKALDDVRIAAMGAKVGIADIEETTNALTYTLQSGVRGVHGMSQAMGVFNTIVGEGDMTMSQLVESIGTGGLLANAKTFGVSIQEVGAALAVFGDNGVKGADASTALQQVMMDFAKPAAGGAKALDAIGLSVTKLRDDMNQHGLNAAIQDLDKHFKAAGITGTKVGAELAEIFTKKASKNLGILMGNVDLWNVKLKGTTEGAHNFGAAWDATTKTTSFAFQKLRVEFEAGGIALMQKVTPAVTGIASVIGTVLPAALSGAGQALHPFVTAWHALADILAPVGPVLESVGHFLAPLAPIAGGVAAGVASMWLAFKGLQVARVAVQAVVDMFSVMQAKAANGLASMRTYGAGVNATLAGNATEAQLAGRIMQAEFSAISASALQAAAAVDRAAAMEAVAFSDMTAASKISSDAQVLAADRATAAALAQARASAEAAAVAVGSAEAAALAIDAAGESAAVGWSAILGPIAAVGIGVALLVSMFHRSSGASKEAAAAAKAYTDALKGDGGQTNLVDTITTQLTNAKLPEALRDLNKALGGTAYNGKQFVDAITAGGKPLDDLRNRLKKVVTDGTSLVAVSGGRAVAVVKQLSPAAQAAQKALGHLNTQFTELSKAAQKDLLDTKTFAGASSSIDKVSQATAVGSERAKTYAAMVGILTDKNGIAAVSSNTLTTAVRNVAGAYNNATQSGSEFLSALNTFSQSAGTAADRGALIGATLKTANGDALEFASTMTATASATSTLTDAFAQQSQALASQSKDQQKAAQGVTSAHGRVAAATARLTAAEARLAQVRGNSKSTAAQISAAEASVASAQNAVTASANHLTDAQGKAGQAGALAYKDTERAALHFKKTTDGLTASIDTNAKGAGDLITQLQGIQTAAMAAASAMFQHEKDTKGAKAAADDAYNVYVQKTQGTLVDNAKKLGLTHKQAVALSKTYFGMPKNVKTLIEAEGTNPILTVLNKIGALLAHLTGQQWDITAGVKIDTSALRDLIKKYPFLGSSVNANGVTHIKGGGGYASGGLIKGSGAKGVDSVPLAAPGALGAPGEFVMTTRAVDKYGASFFQSLNAGVIDKSHLTSAPTPQGAMRSAPVQQGDKHVNLTVNYPEPEQASSMLPRALRTAANQLDGL